MLTTQELTKKIELIGFEHTDAFECAKKINDFKKRLKKHTRKEDIEKVKSRLNKFLKEKGLQNEFGMD